VGFEGLPFGCIDGVVSNYFNVLTGNGVKRKTSKKGNIKWEDREVALQMVTQRSLKDSSEFSLSIFIDFCDLSHCEFLVACKQAQEAQAQ